MLWKKSPLDMRGSYSLILVKIEHPIFSFDFCEVNIISNIPVCQQNCSKYVGCPQQFLSLLHNTAMAFVVSPMLCLTVSTTVNNCIGIFRIIIWRIYASSAPHGCLYSAVGACCRVNSLHSDR